MSKALRHPKFTRACFLVLLAIHPPPVYTEFCARVFACVSGTPSRLYDPGTEKDDNISGASSKVYSRVFSGFKVYSLVFSRW